ncbi:MAG TPA: ATP-binding protein, partial [Bryobacteraceae bacterium]|nr:ATP-binding protein [Bryobacteraceae bacterium]
MIGSNRSIRYGSVFAWTVGAVAFLAAAFFSSQTGPAPVIVVAAGFLIAMWYTGRKRAKRLVETTLAGAGDAVITTDLSGRITFFNPVAEAVSGQRQSEVLQHPVVDVLRLVHEQNREPVQNLVRRALEEIGAVPIPAHTVLVPKDGPEVPLEGNAGAIRNERGKITGAILIFRDVSGRRQRDEQLSHAQKMEAVGRLSAGMAGDFNNVLTVITGYADLLRSELSESTPLRRFADEIIYSAERAAGLTNRLLAFGRGQAAQPKQLDLNALLSGMDPMLRRLLGDSFELILLPGAGLHKVFADASQMEQIVLHLATNARDAMPRGGKLVLETANVDVNESDVGKKINAPPGEYVLLAVSDTGVGMDLETRSRLFEPFFTTKEQGQGSGLGLSMVYGIVKQNGGDITVFSQVNCGTIFEIYLPRTMESSTVPATRQSRASKGSETVLLVDDEDGVRKLVSAILQSKGYSVIEASNGATALVAYDKNAHKIDLVLTDVVMPQMDGFELARNLAGRKEGLKILFMSGYRDSPIGAPTDGRPL